jgi:NAD(P)-dependent dehydrogenase (short-subunit alcohol dehydrogenase family)
VTGAGSGIGQATALRFAAEGASLVVTDVDGDALERTFARLDAPHERVVGDIADEATGAELARVADASFGGIDILINNAGIYRRTEITDTSAADIEQMFGINVKGAIWCCKHAIPLMQRRQRGAIVNMSSISGVTSQDSSDQQSQYLYNVTKAAMLQLTLCLATRYASDGIRANAVCPGVIHTGILRAISPPMSEAEEANMWAEMARAGTPLGRAADPSEVASAILFLASDESSFITGAPLYVDGGFLAR